MGLQSFIMGRNLFLSGNPIKRRIAAIWKLGLSTLFKIADGCEEIKLRNSRHERALSLFRIFLLDYKGLERIVWNAKYGVNLR